MLTTASPPRLSARWWNDSNADRKAHSHASLSDLLNAFVFLFDWYSPKLFSIGGWACLPKKNLTPSSRCAYAGLRVRGIVEHVGQRIGAHVVAGGRGHGNHQQRAKYCQASGVNHR
jgi:hypothetical protein